MKDMLSLSTGLPERVFEAGEAVACEGVAGGAMGVLGCGALQVRKGGVPVNTLSRPGALVGEISVRIDAPYSATVEATERNLVRHADDGPALLRRDPDIELRVAQGLAERLKVVTTHLADLKQQYGDAPALSLVPQMLQRLGQRHGPVARPGAARDPDAEH